MLKRFRRAFLLAISTSVIVMALVFVVAKAGSITPPGPVGSTMHSLSEIYDVLAGTYDSSGQLADIDGNVVQQLKYISNNLGSSLTLQQVYNNSGATPTIDDSSNNAILTLKQTGAGSIFDLQNGSGSLFSIDNAGLISGATGKIQAATGSTFYNEGGYAIAAAGEEILRASIPIFGYDFPARTAATKKISRDILLDVDDTTVLPAVPAGATRKYKFKIQYSTDLAMSGNSVWQITLAGPPVSSFGAPFNVPSTEIAGLEQSKVYYTALISALPDHITDGEWYLTVTAPNLMTIQVYQIELLAYDVLD